MNDESKKFIESFVSKLNNLRKSKYSNEVVLLLKEELEAFILCIELNLVQESKERFPFNRLISESKSLLDILDKLDGYKDEKRKSEMLNLITEDLRKTIERETIPYL